LEGAIPPALTVFDAFFRGNTLTLSVRAWSLGITPATDEEMDAEDYSDDWVKNTVRPKGSLRGPR
jgi:hypothetical protein